MDNLLKVALKSQTVPSGILCIICWLGWPIIIGILKEFQGKDRLQFNCDPKSNEYTTQLCYGNYNSDFSPLSTPLTFAGITFGVSGFGWVIVTLVNVWLLQRIRVEENNTAKEKKKGHFYWTFICHICCQLAFLVVMMGLFCRHQKLEYPAEYRCFAANTTFTCNDLRYNEKSTVNIAIIVVFVLSIVFCLVAIIHLILKRKTISKHLLRNLDDTSTREERRSLDPSNNDPEKGSDNDVTADPYHKQGFPDASEGRKIKLKRTRNSLPLVESAAPTFPSTRETTNYARLCRLLVDFGSQVLRERFDRIHPPGGLETVLARPPALPKLQHLQMKKILNPLQWDILYPDPAIKSSVSSKNFDITLLMVLLRNICGLTPPATGWDALPSPTDLSCEADIARVKFYRNKVCGHSVQASVDDATFHNYWKNIRGTLVRLGEVGYEAAIDGLKYDCLDPELEEHYKDCMDKLINVEAKVDKVAAAVDRIARQLMPTPGEMNRSKQKCELPEKDLNIQGRKKEIDDIVKVLSEERDKVVAGVLVSGTAGVGKSTVAIQAGHRLKNELEAIVKFCSLRGAYKGRSEESGALREILNVCVPDHQQGSECPKYVLFNWCRRLDYELVLIVDNAEDAIGDQGDYNFLNLVSDMRMCSDCRIKFLVTSRRSDIAGAVSNIQFVNISLGPLDVKESIELLKNGAHLTSDTDTDTEVKLREIAELCENIPLALRLAGPLLAEESEYTFEGLKKKLEQNTAKTLGADKMMEIAFEKLDDSLKRALVRLSVFPQSFKRDAAEAILGDNCAADLTNLKKRCLIQKQDDRYLIHILIRSYAKQVGKEELCQILSDGKHGFLRHFLSLILSNARKYWGKDTCKESFILFNEERINLESTLREIAGQKEIQHCSEMEAAMNECQQVAPYIEHCVHFQLYDKFLRGLLQFCQSQGKITKQVEILCLLYHEKRKYSWNYQQKLEDPILQAKELHDRNRSHFERDRLSEAFYLNHYGRYLSEYRNEREQAQPLLKQAISIYKEEPTINDSAFDIGRIIAQMGHNAKYGERREEALQFYTDALRFRSSHYGKHFLTTFAHKDLADYYLRIEDFSKAEESYLKAIQVLDDIKMIGQKEVLPVYRNFGMCCEKRGNIDEARRVLEMGRHVATNTIEGSVRWKVEINTYLALLFYRNYPEEVSTADELSREVFDMSKELKMEKWRESAVLEAFYKRK